MKQLKRKKKQKNQVCIVFLKKFMIEAESMEIRSQGFSNKFICN